MIAQIGLHAPGFRIPDAGRMVSRTGHQFAPVGDHATLITLAVCCSRTAMHSPVFAAQIRMVISLEGDARYWPSGDQAMRLDVRVCPT